MTEENQEPAVPLEPLSQMEIILRNYEAHPGIAARLKDFRIAELRTVQYFSILYNLFQGATLLVSAPTSSGKTLVGEMACVHAILQGKGRCLYMVPLKSLANEKLKDFQDRWEALGVKVEMSTGDMTRIDREKEQEKLEKVELLITTYERADSILRNDAKWFKTIRVVVVDEVHNIGTESRGARLEGLLIRLRQYFPKIQFIYLSATVGNPQDLAFWLRAQPIIHDHRPVPLEYQIPITENKEAKIKEIVVETLRQKGSILIFVPTRYEAQQLCNELSNYLKDRDLLYLIEERARELRVRVNQVRDRMQAGFDSRLYFPMQRGIAFHHAGLSYGMRVAIETLFREGLLKVIACTPTLSSGINLPAKVVIIKDVGLTQSRAPLDVNTFHQMSGRAGRLGFDQSGCAYAFAQCEAERADIQLLYFRPHTLVPKYAPVVSQFMNQETLLEQYLVWIVEDELRKWAKWKEEKEKAAKKRAIKRRERRGANTQETGDLRDILGEDAALIEEMLNEDEEELMEEESSEANLDQVILDEGDSDEAEEEQEVTIYKLENHRLTETKKKGKRVKLGELGLAEDELERMTLKTFWYVNQQGRYPDTTLNHLIEVGHYSLENLLIRHSSEQTIREARALPDSAVKIRQMDAYKLEAIITDRMLIKTAFSRESPDCGCGQFAFQKRLTAPLCPHLVKLAQVAYKLNPSYTKDLLLSALHEEQLIDKLFQYDMIMLRNRRLVATPFGRQTVLLYLPPPLAYWIRLQLPNITFQEKFEQALLYAYDRAQGGRVKAQYAKVLKRLLKEPIPPRTPQDFFYNLQRVAEAENVPFGDLEEFLEAMRWLSNAFQQIAKLDGRALVQFIAVAALLRITPPPEEKSPARQPPPSESTLAPPSDAGSLGENNKRLENNNNKNE